MSISSTMTSLMNAVRSKCALTQKMTLSEATGALNKIELSEAFDYYFDGDPNQCVKTKTNNDIKYVSTVNAENVGTYFPYDQSIISPGNRYCFSALMRGSYNLNRFGDEAKPIYQVINLDSQKWRMITLPFIAKRNFILYGVAKKGQWLELKEPQFFKLGGVIRRLLKATVTPRLEVVA